jgi:hypothetical protein
LGKAQWSESKAIANPAVDQGAAGGPRNKVDRKTKRDAFRRIKPYKASLFIPCFTRCFQLQRQVEGR